MNQGSRAFRNDFQVHTDTEMLSMIEEDRKLREEQQRQELSELTAIASLSDHPGWKIMKKSFEKKISDIRSGKILSAAILDPEINDTKLGQLTRTTNLVATELEALLTTVEAAVQTQKEENEKQ